MGACYTVGYNLSKFLARTFFSFRVVHPERILESGAAIIAMNHQSFFDPPLAGISCKREIFYLARKTLMDIPILGPILPKLNVVPVDNKGADMSALKTVIKIVRGGNCTVIFPEGTRSRDGSLLPAQPGLGLIIAKTLAPVVPMRVFGSFEAFPRDRKFPRLHPITVVVGEPIFFTEADIVGGGRELYQRLSERVLERIAAIKYEPR